MRKLDRSASCKHNVLRQKRRSKLWRSRSKLANSRRLKRRSGARLPRRRLRKRRLALRLREPRSRLPRRRNDSCASSLKAWATTMTPAVMTKALPMHGQIAQRQPPPSLLCQRSLNLQLLHLFHLQAHLLLKL
jgi:hypothetical protein